MKGKRIVITRPPHKAGDFAERLRACGAEPIILPLIQIEPVAYRTALQVLCQNHWDWIIFTSHNTVAQIGKYVPKSRSKIAAIGTTTAQALEELGFHVDLIPQVHTAEGLFEALSQHTTLRLKHIFLPQGDLARPDLANSLRAVGAQVIQVVAYRNIRPHIASELLATPFDAITFTSSSTVQNFVATFDNPLAVIGSAYVVCIGTVTAQTAQDLALPVHGIAEPHSLEGMISTLNDLFQRIPSQ